MGLHNISNYKNYWKEDLINKNNLPKIKTKNQFKLCYIFLSNYYSPDFLNALKNILFIFFFIVIE